MRMLMKVQMPTGSGNDAIKDGSLPQIMASSLEALKAEAAYFTADDGMRTALIFFEMNDSSEIPPAAEPIGMGKADPGIALLKCFEASAEGWEVTGHFPQESVDETRNGAQA